MWTDILEVLSTHRLTRNHFIFDAQAPVRWHQRVVPLGDVDRKFLVPLVALAKQLQRLKQAPTVLVVPAAISGSLDYELNTLIASLRGQTPREKGEVPQQHLLSELKRLTRADIYFLQDAVSEAAVELVQVARLKMPRALDALCRQHPKVVKQFGLAALCATLQDERAYDEDAFYFDRLLECVHILRRHRALDRASDMAHGAGAQQTLTGLLKPENRKWPLPPRLVADVFRTLQS